MKNREKNLILRKKKKNFSSKWKAKLQQNGNTDPSYSDIFKKFLRKALKITSPAEVLEEVEAGEEKDGISTS